MSANNVRIEVQMADILDQYSEEVRRDAREVFGRVSKDTVRRLRSTSPRSKRKGKHYAAGWTSKVNGDGFVVYNRTKWMLTHLLERGTEYTKAQPHIGQARDWAEREVMRELEGKL